MDDEVRVSHNNGYYEVEVDADYFTYIKSFLDAKIKYLKSSFEQPVDLHGTHATIPIEVMENTSVFVQFALDPHYENRILILAGHAPRQNIAYRAFTKIRLPGWDIPDARRVKTHLIGSLTPLNGNHLPRPEHVPLFGADIIEPSLEGLIENFDGHLLSAARRDVHRRYGKGQGVATLVGIGVGSTVIAFSLGLTQCSPQTPETPQVSTTLPGR